MTGDPAALDEAVAGFLGQIAPAVDADGGLVRIDPFVAVAVEAAVVGDDDEVGRVRAGQTQTS